MLNEDDAEQQQQQQQPTRAARGSTGGGADGPPPSGASAARERERERKRRGSLEASGNAANPFAAWGKQMKGALKGTLNVVGLGGLMGDKGNGGGGGGGGMGMGEGGGPDGGPAHQPISMEEEPASAKVPPPRSELPPRPSIQARAMQSVRNLGHSSSGGGGGAGEKVPLTSANDADPSSGAGATVSPSTAPMNPTEELLARINVLESEIEAERARADAFEAAYNEQKMLREREREAALRHRSWVSVVMRPFRMCLG